MPTCDGCGKGVTIDVNGYRADNGEVYCDDCNDAAAAVRRAKRANRRANDAE